MGNKTHGNLLVLALDTHARIDKIHVVGEQRVSAVLRNYTEGNKKHQAVSVALGSEEVHILACLHKLKLEAQSLLDFTVLELNGSVVDITISMVLCKNTERLFVAFLGHQPTW